MPRFSAWSILSDLRESTFGISRLSSKGRTVGGTISGKSEVGANHMGYHVATLLALHEHFLTVGHNPVPQFLVIDQPSQAFFPEGLLPRPSGGKKGEAEPIMRSDDIVRVNRIFRALSAASKRTKSRVQLIIIDHADEMTWAGIDNVHVVERWRGGNALIPRDWLG